MLPHLSCLQSVKLKQGYCRLSKGKIYKGGEDDMSFCPFRKPETVFKGKKEEAIIYQECSAECELCIDAQHCALKVLAMNIQKVNNSLDKLVPTAKKDDK